MRRSSEPALSCGRESIRRGHQKTWDQYDPPISQLLRFLVFLSDPIYIESIKKVFCVSNVNFVYFQFNNLFLGKTYVF